MNKKGFELSVEQEVEQQIFDGTTYCLPCFAARFHTMDDINTVDKAKIFFSKIKQMAYKDSKQRVTVVSVTKKDKHHKVWLESAKELGLVVIETKSRHLGAYKCWMIIQTK